MIWPPCIGQIYIVHTSRRSWGRRIHQINKHTRMWADRQATRPGKPPKNSLKIYRTKITFASSLSLEQYFVQRYICKSLFSAESPHRQFLNRPSSFGLCGLHRLPQTGKKTSLWNPARNPRAPRLCTFQYFLFLFQCLFLIYLMLSLSILLALSCLPHFVIRNWYLLYRY